MQRRRLGNSDLEVSALGLGGMGMSFSYTPLPEEAIANDGSLNKKALCIKQKSADQI